MTKKNFSFIIECEPKREEKVIRFSRFPVAIGDFNIEIEQNDLIQGNILRFSHFPVTIGELQKCLKGLPDDLVITDVGRGESGGGYVSMPESTVSSFPTSPMGTDPFSFSSPIGPLGGAGGGGSPIKEISEALKYVYEKIYAITDMASKRYFEEWAAYNRKELDRLERNEKYEPLPKDPEQVMEYYRIRIRYYTAFKMVNFHYLGMIYQGNIIKEDIDLILSFIRNAKEYYNYIREKSWRNVALRNVTNIKKEQE